FRRLMLEGLSRQDPRVGALLAARDGSSWVAGAFGLLHFDDPRLAERQEARLALTNLNISALAQDDAGVVWAGTRDGQLRRFDSGNWQIQTEFQVSHAITALAPAPDGALWIGTEGDGLHRRESSKSPHSKRYDNLPTAWVSTLHLDGQGTLW